MSAVLMDTSAVIALLDAGDVNHQAAKSAFESLEYEVADLFTTSYVLIEIYALLGRRYGPSAVERFRQDFAPLLEVIWVDEDLHEAGLDLLLDRASKSLSLVDAVSLVAIRARGADRVFAYDRHFENRGFEMVGQ